MDRNRTTDSKALRRIAAVLLALADLAGCPSGRSFAVRAPVLWLLRSAEVLARDYLSKLAPDTVGQPLRFTRDSAAEAIRLATSFRQLAAALTALAADSPAPSPQTRMLRFATLAPAGIPTAFATQASAVQRRDSS